MKSDRELPGILEARHEATVVKAQLAAPGLIVELCDFPALRGEDRITCETETVLSLGLSPLLPDSSGRYRPGPYSRFARFGSLNLRPAGVPLEYRHAGGGFTSVRCRFDAADTLELSVGESWSVSELEACMNIHDPRIEEAMLRLAEECERPDAYSATLAHGLGRAILVDLARYFRAIRLRETSRRGGLSAVHLRRIAEYVEHGAGPAGITEIAELCGLSRSHLMRAFRQSTGKSVAKYVEGVRIARAKTLLAETMLPIAEIATRLGFPSAPAFSHVFRRATGRTPRDYRAWVG